jgi:hypothetical protein
VSIPYFKLTPEDQTVIRRHLAATPVVHVNFSSLMYYKWGQNWLVKEEVENQLFTQKLSFRESARKVAIAMCLAKAHGTDYGKRFSDNEDVGFYFVRRIFKPFADRPVVAGKRKPDFYDSSFWASPVVLVWVIEAIDLWFEHDMPPLDSFFAFATEQVDEILGPHPHTDPDYP